MKINKPWYLRFIKMECYGIVDGKDGLAIRVNIDVPWYFMYLVTIDILGKYAINLLWNGSK